MNFHSIHCRKMRTAVNCSIFIDKFASIFAGPFTLIDNNFIPNFVFGWRTATYRRLRFPTFDERRNQQNWSRFVVFLHDSQTTMRRRSRHRRHDSPSLPHFVIFLRTHARRQAASPIDRFFSCRFITIIFIYHYSFDVDFYFRSFLRLPLYRSRSPSSIWRQSRRIISFCNFRILFSSIPSFTEPWFRGVGLLSFFYVSSIVYRALVTLCGSSSRSSRNEKTTRNFPPNVFRSSFNYLFSFLFYSAFIWNNDERICGVDWTVTHIHTQRSS